MYVNPKTTVLIFPLHVYLYSLTKYNLQHLITLVYMFLFLIYCA